MNIGIVTTSRADFGIYLPLLKCIEETDSMSYSLFVGGMHTEDRFGNSWKLIEEQGYSIKEKVKSLSNDDLADDISYAIANTALAFGTIWKKYATWLDLVFFLGDRYEMFGAASSLIPYNVSIAHIHGGEITLGAIDNKFRNAITSFADLHFASTKEHAENVRKITLGKGEIYNVGSLGVESALSVDVYNKSEFEERYKVNISKGYVLSTYHPETVGLNNEQNINELIWSFEQIPFKILFTLPNADTEGNIIRNKILKYEKMNPEKIVCFENLGQKGYFSAMHYCKMLMGNTSSGIIEAASFNKWVINVGNRQKGRMHGKNVITVPNLGTAIIKEFDNIVNKSDVNFDNPYGNGNSSSQIVEALKKWKLNS